MSRTTAHSLGWKLIPAFAAAFLIGSPVAAAGAEVAAVVVGRGVLRTGLARSARS